MSSAEILPGALNGVYPDPILAAQNCYVCLGFTFSSVDQQS